MNELELISTGTEIVPQDQINIEDLTNDQKISLMANLLGYRTLPVDVETFIRDPYYCGNFTQNLFPKWLEVLKEIFPDPITCRYPYVILSGAIGLGKSTAARLIALYNLYKLTCLRDVHKSLGLIPGKNVVFSFFSKSADLSVGDFIGPVNDWMRQSPYFKTILDANNGSIPEIELDYETPLTRRRIGRDVIFANLSEISFINKETAQTVVSEYSTRFDSRFHAVRKYFGAVIYDCSARGDDSIVDDLIADPIYAEDTLVKRFSQWEIRDGVGFDKTTFTVYAGDSVNAPVIINESNPRLPSMDPDRFVEVPTDLLPDFRHDLIQALQDKAGISTRSSDLLFPHPDELNKCFTLTPNHQQVVTLDLHGSDRLMYNLAEAVEKLPKDRKLYIHLDLGTSSDLTGFSVAYWEDWKSLRLKDNTLQMPVIKVPISIGIGRSQGDETFLYGIEEFIKELIEMKFQIGLVSADTYQSKMMLQNLERAKIPTMQWSLERSDEPWLQFKQLVGNGCVQMQNSPLLKKGFLALKHVGTKVEKPRISELGHCDVQESLVGAVINVCNNLDEASKTNTQFSANAFVKARNEIHQYDADQRVNDMLSGLF